MRKTTYKFYCDNCNALIMDSEINENGYAEEPEEFNIFVRLNSSENYEYSTHLCDECMASHVKAVRDMLKSQGFK